MQIEIKPYTVGELANALSNFPADGKPLMDALHAELVRLGFIAEHEVTKPCKTCGTPRVDYRFFKLTAGGRLFLKAATKDSPHAA